MSFEDAENRANASALGRVANARALIGATDFPVIFDNGVAAAAQGMIDAAQPSIIALASDLGVAAKGDAVTVTYRSVATSYLLRNPVPDGTGLIQAGLELAL